VFTALLSLIPGTSGIAVQYRGARSQHRDGHSVDPTNADLHLDVFDNPNNALGVKLEQGTKNAWISQRKGYDSNNLIYCESRGEVKASVQKVVSLIQGPWTWWYGGRQQNRVVTPTGTDYLLYPTTIGVLVHEFMHKEQPFKDGFVIKIDFLPDQESWAQGLGYFLINPSANKPGYTTVIGRFAAVKFLPHIPPMTHQMFTDAHLLVEGGTLIETGWFHFIRIAEGLEQLPTDSVFPAALTLGRNPHNPKQ